MQAVRQPWQVTHNGASAPAAVGSSSFAASAMQLVAQPPPLNSPKIDSRMLNMGGSFGAPVGPPVAAPAAQPRPHGYANGRPVSPVPQGGHNSRATIPISPGKQYRTQIQPGPSSCILASSESMQRLQGRPRSPPMQLRPEPAVLQPVLQSPSFVPAVIPKYAPAPAVGGAPVPCNGVCGWAGPLNHSPTVSPRGLADARSRDVAPSEVGRNPELVHKAGSPPPRPDDVRKAAPKEPKDKSIGHPSHERERTRKADASKHSHEAPRSARQHSGCSLQAPWANHNRQPKSPAADAVALEEPLLTDRTIPDDGVRREWEALKESAQVMDAKLRSGRQSSGSQHQLDGELKSTSNLTVNLEFEREKELDARRAELSSLEEACRRSKVDLEAREQGLIADKQRLLAEMQEMANRNAELVQREQNLANREAELQAESRSREQALQNRDEEVRSREKRVAEREEKVFSSAQNLAAKEAEVREKQEQHIANQKREEENRKQIAAELVDKEEKLKSEEERLKQREKLLDERELRWGEACKDARVLQQCQQKPRFTPRSTGKENDLHAQLEEQQNKMWEIKRKPGSWLPEGSADVTPTRTLGA